MIFWTFSRCCQRYFCYHIFLFLQCLFMPNSYQQLLSSVESLQPSRPLKPKTFSTKNHDRKVDTTAREQRPPKYSPRGGCWNLESDDDKCFLLIFSSTFPRIETSDLFTLPLIAFGAFWNYWATFLIFRENNAGCFQNKFLNIETQKLQKKLKRNVSSSKSLSTL